MLAFVAGGCGPASEGDPASGEKAASRRSGADAVSPEMRSDGAPLELDTAGKRVLERKKLPIGTKAPPFELVDQDGAKVSLSDFSGSVVSIGFIYTHCPDVCGLLTKSYIDLQAKFSEQIDAGKLTLILVTTDPERDVPERIAKYTTANGGKWKFLTGDFKDCEQVWKDYGVTRTFNPSAQYVYHTYKIVLIDGKGDLRFDFVGLDDPERDLYRDINSLLGGKP